MNEANINSSKEKILKKLLAISAAALIAAFMGYVAEVIWILLRYGFIDNRGMHLPFIIGYGIANVIVYALLGSSKNPKIYIFKRFSTSNRNKKIIYIIELFVFITFCESLLGNLTQTLFSVEWWDFNSIPGNIGQYSSIPTSAVFTLCLYLYIQKILVPIYLKFQNEDFTPANIIIIMLFVMALADCIWAFIYMFKHKAINLIYRKRMISKKWLLHYR